jgi:protease-4
VRFRGVIRERSVDQIAQLLKGISQRGRFKGVLLDISSGGGADVPSTDFYLAVKRLDQTKPVIASIGSIGASGAYLAAIGARKVYAYPDSEVGSIGVLFPHIAVRELLNRLGIEVELLHQGRHKDAYQGYRPLTDEERTKLMAVAENSYKSFVETVARERKRPSSEILNLATGEIWSGTQALNLGLVDALGDRDVALAELSQLTGVPVRNTVRVAPPRAFVDRLVSTSASVFAGAMRQGLQETVEDWVWDGTLFRR